MNPLGIQTIGVYLPTQRVFNFTITDRFDDFDEGFLRDKIGVIERPVKDLREHASDMALHALEALLARGDARREEIELLVVVTQNPDSNIPHVSPLVHARAGLPDACATFDISLGCSGYVYGLSIVQSLMAAQGMRYGVLITADPYSSIVDPEDRNTALLFGDAATATLIGDTPTYRTSGFSFSTFGDIDGALACHHGKLRMDGRAVFNFAATRVPENLADLFARSRIEKEAVDCFIFHQGSRYIIDTLTRRMGLRPERVRSDIRRTGNTVSSSIPILLAHELDNPDSRTMLLCGFGVGLSVASCICHRTK